MIVQGKDFTIYTGDGVRKIGCEESCSLTITTEDIITTSLGSGAATNREYGGYDWSVSSNGVLFIQDAFDGTGNLDPLEFAAYILQGIKVTVKIQVTDTKYYFGTGLLKSATYQGTAEGIATYSIEILGDGELTPTTNLKSDLTGAYSDLDILNVFLELVDEYQNDLLIGATIEQLLVNGYAEAYTFDDATGTVTFTGGLTVGNMILIYIPA